MTSVLDNITRIADEIKARQEEIQDLSKKGFRDSIQQIFDEFEFLGAIKWTQWTPYFNDGDPCEFSVGTPTLYTIKDAKSILKSEEDLEDDEDEDYDEDDNGSEFQSKLDAFYSWQKPGENADPRYVEAYESVHKLFSALDDSFFEKTFDNHVTVIIPREGDPIVEEYYHE